MSEDMKCQYCGADLFLTLWSRRECLYACGSGSEKRSSLCLERAEMQLQLSEKTAEVDRFRELLNRAIIKLAFYERREVLDIDKELARLDYAPEEPATEGTRIAAEARTACNDMTEEEREKLREKTNEVMEWREFTGKREMICEGDEICRGTGAIWWPCTLAIGRYANEYTSKVRFRTRRPLPPVVDQSQSKWFKEREKQEDKKYFISIPCKKCGKDSGTSYLATNPLVEISTDALCPDCHHQERADNSDLLVRALAVEPLTLSGSFELRAIRAEYDARRSGGRS